MLASHYVKPRTFSTEHVEVPPPAAGEVQIAVAYTGICGTDLHIFHGDMDHRVSAPAPIGHEMSGTIAAIGPEVTEFTIGDPVTVFPLDHCGNCAACQDGNQHICYHLNFIGIDSPGSMQQRWNVAAAQVIPLPAGVDLQHAALVEPVAVAVHDVRRGGVQPGDHVVVIGGGPIGILIAAVATHAGAHVTLSEIDPSRRAAAEDLGITTIDPIAVGDLGAWAHDWTDGRGADVVFEVSGAARPVLDAPSLLRARGTLVIVAIHTEPKPIDLHRFFWRELTLVGARVYE